MVHSCYWSLQGTRILLLCNKTIYSFPWVYRSFGWFWSLLELVSWGLAGTCPVEDGLTYLSDFSVMLIKAWSLWWHWSKKEYGNAQLCFSSHYFCQFLFPYHWSKQVTWPNSDLAYNMPRDTDTERCEKLKPLMHLI